MAKNAVALGAKCGPPAHSQQGMGTSVLLRKRTEICR